MDMDYKKSQIAALLDQNNPFPCRHLPPIPTVNKESMAVQAYCVCNKKVEMATFSSGEINTNIQEQSKALESKTGIEKSVEELSIPRQRKNSLPRITRRLRNILNKLKKDPNLIIRFEPKSKKGLHNGLSHRRSLYIGCAETGTTIKLW